MATDFRALCAELLIALENAISIIYYEGGTKHISTAKPIVNRARAALTDEPAVPEGRESVAVTGQPSDEELTRLWFETDGRAVLGAKEYARAVLARWGNLKARVTSSTPADGEVAELVAWLREIGDTIQPSHLAEHQRYKRAAELLQRQVLVPVPVSERLPGPEDCDGEGRCWYWRPSHPESGYLEGWMLRPSSWGVGHYDFDDSVIHTHWLSAHALPLPEVGE